MMTTGSSWWQPWSTSNTGTLRQTQTLVLPTSFYQSLSRWKSYKKPLPGNICTSFQPFSLIRLKSRGNCQKSGGKQLEVQSHQPVKSLLLDNFILISSFKLYHSCTNQLLPIILWDQNPTKSFQNIWTSFHPFSFIHHKSRGNCPRKLLQTVSRKSCLFSLKKFDHIPRN